MEPSDRAQQRAIFPLEDVVARAVQDRGLCDRVLERAPDLVLRGRWPGEAAAPALVVGQHAVDGAACATPRSSIRIEESRISSTDGKGRPGGFARRDLLRCEMQREIGSGAAAPRGSHPKR